MDLVVEMSDKMYSQHPPREIIIVDDKGKVLWEIMEGSEPTNSEAVTPAKSNLSTRGTELSMTPDPKFPPQTPRPSSPHANEFTFSHVSSSSSSGVRIVNEEARDAAVETGGPVMGEKSSIDSNDEREQPEAELADSGSSQKFTQKDIIELSRSESGGEEELGEEEGGGGGERVERWTWSNDPWAEEVETFITSMQINDEKAKEEPKETDIQAEEVEKKVTTETIDMKEEEEEEEEWDNCNQIEVELLEEKKTNTPVDEMVSFRESQSDSIVSAEPCSLSEEEEEHMKEGTTEVEGEIDRTLPEEEVLSYRIDEDDDPSSSGVLAVRESSLWSTFACCSIPIDGLQWWKETIENMHGPSDLCLLPPPQQQPQQDGDEDEEEQQEIPLTEIEYEEMIPDDLMPLPDHPQSSQLGKLPTVPEDQELGTDTNPSETDSMDSVLKFDNIVISQDDTDEASVEVETVSLGSSDDDEEERREGIEDYYYYTYCHAGSPSLTATGGDSADPLISSSSGDNDNISVSNDGGGCSCSSSSSSSKWVTPVPQNMLDFYDLEVGPSDEMENRSSELNELRAQQNALEEYLKHLKEFSKSMQQQQAEIKEFYSDNSCNTTPMSSCGGQREVVFTF